MDESRSFLLAKDFLGKEVEVIIDRQLGTKHPKHGFVYDVNYGFVAGVLAPDGEELDAYYLGVDKPVERGRGKCVAIIHRTNDDDDKLVVVAEGFNSSDEEIDALVQFQEKWFEHKIFRQ